MDIAVIGAGPSGIMAALQAARGGGRVCLFDHNDQIGRKLLITGSSRCNLTNSSVAPQAYTCQDQDWMAQFLNHFGLQEFLAELDILGIPTKHTDDGWYYPLSNSAHSVRDILWQLLKERAIELRVAINIKDIQQQQNKYLLILQIKGREWVESFDRLVIAAGGRAYPELGSRGELFPALQTLGHTINPLFPALGPIFVDLQDYSTLKGLRFDVSAAVYSGETQLGQTIGNVIVTEKGFNGPGVMNLSHLVALHPTEDLTLQVNFMAPHWADLADRLARLEDRSGSLRTLLLRVFPPKAVEFFLKNAQLDPNRGLGQLTEEELRQLLQATAGPAFHITGSGNFKNSQVSVGGVPVTEVDPLTLESKLHPGLYLVGETLDAIGPCGGFNLHFAFGTGFLAGKHLAD